MKLLLVIGSDDTFDRVSYYTKAMGFDLIRYRYVLKSMDNLEEVEPQGIIISAQDFPWHWKVLLQFVRSEWSKEQCPIIILKGSQFPLEAASKAFYLGVNGLVMEALDDPLEIKRLQGILRESIPAQEQYRVRRYFEDSWNRFGLVISHPFTQVLITGRVISISACGISFYPDYLTSMKDIPVNMELPGCSLRAGKQVLSPVCKLIHPGRVAILEFRSFQGNEQALLEAYLQGRELSPSQE
ncbi:MAG: PilZ domain-containing protein [Treponema sp.]|jgi:hypothetical protein|nr:PilZ domain-containing protein [Treponema sp.]